MPGSTQAGHSKPVECPICQQRFTREYTKNQHILIVHENAGRFKCDQCNKTFGSKKFLKEHRRVHTGEKPFECPICEKKFASESIRRRHIIVVHENAGQFKCGHCDKTFQDKRAFAAHERSHTGERPFECSICEKKFASKQHKQHHMIMQHENSGRFKCGHCERTFQFKKDMENHERVHTGEKPFECTICRKSFAREAAKKKHFLVVHQNAGSFKCDNCGKTFRSKAHLERHETVHTRERPFECPICRKGFSTDQTLNSHVIVVHENAGRFKCAHCDKTWQSKATLENHERSHTGERPFRCEICQMQLKNKSGLKRHHLDLHSEKKFTCDQCGKSFGRKPSLQLHLATHSDERINCKLCGKSIKPTCLRHHMKDVHLGIQRKSRRRRRLVRNEDQKEREKEGQKERQKELRVRVEQPDGSNDLGSATYSLRVRRKTPNYTGEEDVESEESGEESSADSSPENSENGSDFQDSDGESSESDEEADESDGILDEEKQDDVLVGGNERPTKRVKTENWVADGEVHAFDDPIRSSQRIIKREHDSDSQTENDVNMTATPYESSDPVQRASPVITLSSEKDGILHEEASAPEQNDSRVICHQIGTKKVKTEHLVVDGKVQAFDDPISQQTIKREPDLDGQAGKDEDMATAQYESKNPVVQGVSPVITLSSDDESDQVGELPPPSSIVSNTNLKLVYDVEYRPPY